MRNFFKQLFGKKDNEQQLVPFKNLTCGQFIYIYDKRTDKVVYRECNTLYRHYAYEVGYTFVLWINWDDEDKDNFLYPDPRELTYENSMFFVSTYYEAIKCYIEDKYGTMCEAYKDVLKLKV